MIGSWKKGSMKVSMIALILVLVFVTGCSGKNDNNQSSGNPSETNKELQPESAKPGPKQIVKFWSHQNNLKDKMTELIDNYNATNTDGIEIELNVVADKYNDVLSLAFTSGEGPDIFTITGPSGTRKWAENKWAEPLDSYITDEFKGKFRDGVWVEDNNLINGEIYTLPDTASTMRMIYNKELFKQAGLDPEKPPITFAEMREYAKKITESSGGKAVGYGLPLADGYNIDVSVFNGIGHLAVGSTRGFDHSKGQFDFGVYSPVVQLFTDMEEDGSMLEGAMLINGDQGRAKFAEGTIGMMGAASWDPGIYASMDMKFDMGVTDYPTIDGNAKGKPIIQTGSGYMMSASTKDKEKTWIAMEFLFSPEFAGEIRKTDGGIYC
jgi:multiple sugar transport system substrate-binding protein